MLDLPRASTHPLFGSDRWSNRVYLVVEGEERVIARVECPDSRIRYRHGGDGLQLGADDIVAEVVELQVNSLSPLALR